MKELEADGDRGGNAESAGNGWRGDRDGDTSLRWRHRGSAGVWFLPKPPVMCEMTI